MEQRPASQTVYKNMKQVPLFGGAITISVPEVLVDESDFYPIPDNQEVYHDFESKQSLIVEIVEHVTESSMDGMSPAAFYAKDIADMNHATVCLDSGENGAMDATMPPLLAARVESMTEGETMDMDSWTGWLDHDRALQLAVVRIPSKDSDIVISMMTPLSSDDLEGKKRLDDVFYGGILKGLDIVDWELFGS